MTDNVTWGRRILRILSPTASERQQHEAYKLLYMSHLLSPCLWAECWDIKKASCLTISTLEKGIKSDVIHDGIIKEAIQNKKKSFRQAFPRTWFVCGLISVYCHSQVCASSCLSSWQRLFRCVCINVVLRLVHGEDHDPRNKTMFYLRW